MTQTPLPPDVVAILKTYMKHKSICALSDSFGIAAVGTKCTCGLDVLIEILTAQLSLIKDLFAIKTDGTIVSYSLDNEMKAGECYFIGTWDECMNYVNTITVVQPPSPAPEALVERCVDAFKKTMEPIPLINHDAMEQRFRTALTNTLLGMEDELVGAIKSIARPEKQVSGEVVLSDITVSNIRTAIRAVLKGGGA